ncbi:hypothetical protein E2C01_003166 [Portunus trituberculatus]|uniref:Uncharacterized protein n=1 Tax=Portunus trituberculatus TaxID=210409 RepID=A0A5B7CM74_PORTR|nr:hypothetical protein [Portunus trituberculatus]
MYFARCNDPLGFTLSAQQASRRFRRQLLGGERSCCNIAAREQRGHDSLIAGQAWLVQVPVDSIHVCFEVACSVRAVRAVGALIRFLACVGAHVAL